MEKERTLLMIKPDVIKNNKIGEIINFLECKKNTDNFDIIGIKTYFLSKEESEYFYNEHKNKPFFRSLINFISNSKVVVLCLSGQECIRKIRKIIGNNDPKFALDGTIRRKYGSDIEANAVHASDCLESAVREIKFFFNENELFTD